MRVHAYIQELISSRRYDFGSSDVWGAIGGSRAAMGAQLPRRKHQGCIAEPARSFHATLDARVAPDAIGDNDA